MTFSLHFHGGANAGVEAEVEEDALIVQLTHCNSGAFGDLHHEAVERARIIGGEHPSAAKNLEGGD